MSRSANLDQDASGIVRTATPTGIPVSETSDRVTVSSVPISRQSVVSMSGAVDVEAAWLDRLVVESGIAPRLRDHGITQGDLALLASEAMKQQRLLVNNPCLIDEADARRLYEAAW